VIRVRALTTISLALAATVVLAACNRGEEDILFDGQKYKTKARKEADDLAVFVASITPVSASLDGAREAGRYEGTKYCIENYGTSKIKWTVGPDTDPETLTISDDTLVFRGECNP
jgi:predicted small secreted protein